MQLLPADASSRADCRGIPVSRRWGGTQGVHVEDVMMDALIIEKKGSNNVNIEGF
jgi:hypothetical protein